MRQLRAVEGDGLPAALYAALSGSGPAVFAGAPSEDLPSRIAARVALVVESSGSTGRPKRVVLSSDALLASAAASESALGGAGQWLLALPTHYIAGINVLVRSIAAGTDPVVLEEGPFDADRFARAARDLEAPARFTSLVPAQLARLLESDAALPALRRFDRVLVGGQATPPALLARAHALGVRVTRTYGSSETSGGCVYDGVPIGQAEVAIVDGQVELAGPMLADGYLDDAERTDRAFRVRDGRRWYRTGDLGAVSEGVLSVTGRVDDMIVSGGVNVSLAAVEARVREWQGLGEAVVVAASSERWGEVPVVVTATDATLASLRAFVAEALGPAAAPARVVVVERIPVLASGKPDRVAVRAMLPH